MEENNSLQTRQDSRNLQRYSQNDQGKILSVLSSFGDDYQVQVFNRYNKAVGIEKAVAAKAPSFHDVSKRFGKEAISFWLRYHIADTFLFVGIYDTATKYQIQQTAELILQHEVFGQLTLAEFLNFLQRFKQGRYDKIYQSNRPNPQEFLRCLQPYWNELCYARGKQEEKERLDKLSEQRNSGENISWEDWKAEKEKRGENVININNPLKI